jgi:isoquinoline 1-oxidoreductase beta subunit
MVYASVMQSPMEGAKPKDVNVPDVMKVKGVSKVIPLPFGVAVIGDTVEATRAGVQALKVTWDTSGATAAGFDSDKAKADYAAKGKDANAETKVEYQVGDAKAGIGGAAKTVEAAYWSEYTYHAQIEPMNAVAQVSEDGKSADIWTGTQFGALAAGIISGILKTTPDQIRIHNQFLGGGFGRRIWPDAAIQAAILSNITKKPVKLILTREEDLAAARPRPMTHHVLKAGLDAKGNIVGWHHRLVSENVDAVAAPPRFQATGGKDYIGARGLDQAFYAMPNVLAEYVRENHARACLARHRLRLQQVCRRSLPRRSCSNRWQGSAGAAARTDQGQAARQCRDQGRGRDVRLRQEAAGPWHGDRVLRLSRHLVGGRG